jgi:hypothetical protein
MRWLLGMLVAVCLLFTLLVHQPHAAQSPHVLGAGRPTLPLASPSAVLPSIYGIRLGATRAEVRARMGNPDVSWSHRYLRRRWAWQNLPSNPVSYDRFDADFFENRPADQLAGDRMEWGTTILHRGCTLNDVERVEGQPIKVQRLNHDCMDAYFPGSVSVLVEHGHIIFFELEAR